MGNGPFGDGTPFAPSEGKRPFSLKTEEAMRLTSTILLWLGLAVVLLGTGQFILVVALSPDPNPNPAVNGMLMWLSWFVGAAIAGAGLYMRGWRFPWV
jgi:hypothetical protein